MAGKKRTLGADGNNGEVIESAPKKLARGCLSSLSAGQIAEMKRFMRLSSDHLNGYTHRELRPMWNNMGMTVMYPAMTCKAKIIERLQSFAKKNLEGHDIAVVFFLSWRKDV